MISNAKTPAAAKRLQGVPTCCNGGFVTKLTCSAPTTSYPQHPGWFALLYSFWLAQMQGSPAPGLAVLSMHQPWASLLVYGLKRIEGRAWPTDYNGRLWIHATSTKPTAQDIEEMLGFYKQLHKAEGRDVTPNLPTSYPTSVLIGCVDVVACYPASAVEAWEALPDTIKQEVGSPYCFLCENPKRLVVPQQMRGHPKLWQLPSKTASTLTAALKTTPDPVPFSWAPFGRPDTLNTKADEPSSRSSLWYDKYGKVKKEQARNLSQIPNRLAGTEAEAL